MTPSDYMVMSSVLMLGAASTIIVVYRHYVEWQQRKNRRK